MSIVIERVRYAVHRLEVAIILWRLRRRAEEARS
jgi:hypothetical protein